MEMQTVLPYIAFVAACFVFAASVFMAFAKGVTSIATALMRGNVVVTFYPQVWSGGISFAVIMGYIFIM